MLERYKKHTFKKIRRARYGHVHINATYTNTLITITDRQGNTVSWSSAGCAGFSGARKSTSYAAQAAAESAGKKAVLAGIRAVKLVIRGFGPGRISSTKGLLVAGLRIFLIGDITSIPHNGCKPKKRRRV